MITIILGIVIGGFLLNLALRLLYKQDELKPWERSISKIPRFIFIGAKKVLKFVLILSIVPIFFGGLIWIGIKRDEAKAQERQKQADLLRLKEIQVKRKNLRGIVGKYPSQDSVFQQNIWITNRLEKLIGQQYDNFTTAMLVEGRIVQRHGFIVLQGCFPHNCSGEYGKIFIDTMDLMLHAQWAKNGRTIAYSEDRRKYPEIFGSEVWIDK